MGRTKTRLPGLSLHTDKSKLVSSGKCHWYINRPDNGRACLRCWEDVRIMTLDTVVSVDMWSPGRELARPGTERDRSPGQGRGGGQVPGTRAGGGGSRSPGYGRGTSSSGYGRGTPGYGRGTSSSGYGRGTSVERPLVSREMPLLLGKGELEVRFPTAKHVFNLVLPPWFYP